MEKSILNLSGMHCASCASNIESALKKVSGVIDAQVNFAQEKAHIEFHPQKLRVEDLIAAIEKAGYKAFLPDLSLDKESQIRNLEVKSLKRKFILSMILSSILMLVSMGPCVGLSMHKFVMQN